MPDAVKREQARTRLARRAVVVCRLLVAERGWPPARYEAWLATTVQQLT